MTEAPQRGVELGLYVFVHPVKVPRGRRVVLEKGLAQPDGAERLRVAFQECAVVGGDDLGGTAADVDHEDAFVGLWPDALHAEVNETRFFAAGDDFDGDSGGFPGAGEELALIAGVAYG